MTQPGGPSPTIVIVDASNGAREPGPGVTRFAFAYVCDPFDGSPRTHQQTTGAPEPLNWRFEDLKRITQTGHLDQRVAIQLIADGDGPLDRALGYLGQSGLWTPTNRSTRIVDASGREALLASALRVVGSLDGRNVLALALYPAGSGHVSFPDEINPRGWLTLSELGPELDPRGYVLGHGWPVPADQAETPTNLRERSASNPGGSSVRGAEVERFEPRIGLLPSIYLPEGARGWVGVSPDGIRVGPLPIRIGAHFAAGEVDNDGAAWDGPLDYEAFDAADLPAKAIYGVDAIKARRSIDPRVAPSSPLDKVVSLATFLGYLAPYHDASRVDFPGDPSPFGASKADKDARIDHEADAKEGRARGNCRQVVVVPISAAIPPESKPTAQPGRKTITGPGGGGPAGPPGPPGPPGPAGPRGPRGGAGSGSGAGCNKVAAPAGPVGGLLTDPQPAGELAGDGVTSVDLAPWARHTPACARTPKPKPKVGLGGDGTPGGIDEVADFVAGVGEGVGALPDLPDVLLSLPSVPEPGSSARSLQPADGIPSPNTSSSMYHDGRRVLVPGGHAPIARDEKGDLVVLGGVNGSDRFATDGQALASHGVGDYNTANYPVPIFGEPGGPITLDGAVKLLGLQVAALQQVILGLTGGPQHLEGNLAAIARDRASFPAGHHLGSQWAGDRDVSEPTVAIVGVLQAPARATDETQGVSEVHRVHIGNPDDKRPLIALHDETTAGADQLRGVDDRWNVSKLGDERVRSTQVARLPGESDGALVQVGWAPAAGEPLGAKLFEIIAADGLTRIGQPVDDGTILGGLALAEQSSAPTALDALPSDQKTVRLIPVAGGSIYLVPADGSTPVDLAATGGGTGLGTATDFGGDGTAGSTTIAVNAAIPSYLDASALVVDTTKTYYGVESTVHAVRSSGAITINGTGSVLLSGKGETFTPS